MSADAANSILNVDGNHGCGIGPPEFSDDFISQEPGVRLLEFVRYEHFCRIDGGVFSDQVLVGREAADPGSSGGEFIVQHEFVSGEA